eukprot:TRINITY_DN92629_c0_g1_i1.p1 TRINITY_DN92629_c0_g1~~TRINITY_DN92629_c0_g1_i1.p1  ORF type:complete len:845 (+),score=209.16 TRINITY_DN92629_c0_g1_i1:78-2537(+)
MAQASFLGGAEDQERLLDEATSVVKEQAYFMKRGMDSDNLREALKHASNMICELRTGLLSPKNYYELYMQVFSEMQTLSAFFGDKSRHGRSYKELYESVQHAGSILPRMYLLATVGANYIKSKECSAKEILTDMNELCKGVQHPMRGLFLRYFLSQMVKDRLPDTGSEYEGEGGNIEDAFNFVFQNFCESNRLWVRMQHQGAAKDKAKREKERHDLRVLVGANLVRMSQLEGMTSEFYSQTALPKLLEHITTVRETMSQQYLFESMIQVFPDEFHIQTLETTLGAYSKAAPTVDMKPVMVALMSRLSNYLTNSENGANTNVDIFSLMRTHLQAILERALEPPPTVAGQPPAMSGPPDIGAPLEVQAAFMSFISSLYPDKIHYVDMIMGSTVDLLNKYFVRIGDTTSKLAGPAAEKVSDLLSAPLSTFSLSVLQMEHYSTLLNFLNFQARKRVAVTVVQIVLDGNKALRSAEAVQSLFSFIQPLLKDLPDTPPDEGKNKSVFASEQVLIARLVHQIRGAGLDDDFQMLMAMRSFFGEGGPDRLSFTLPPVLHYALKLVDKMGEQERRRAEGDDTVPPPPGVSRKKIFQFVHKTNSQLKGMVSLQHWLLAAGATDRVIAQTGQAESLEPICYEFFTQAVIIFEEELDSAKQFQALPLVVGGISRAACLDTENAENIRTKIVKVCAAQMLKKPMQCRAISICTHMFWNDVIREDKMLKDCLQKCLKLCSSIADQDVLEVVLWVEMLDKYVYYFEAGCSEVQGEHLQQLFVLCKEHIEYASKSDTGGAQAAAVKARDHLKSIISYLDVLRNSDARLAQFAFEA